MGYVNVYVATWIALCCILDNDVPNLLIYTCLPYCIHVLHLEARSETMI